MSARMVVLRKDVRLAATVVLPSVVVLGVVCSILVFGHVVPGVGQTLWGSGGSPPVVAERLATFQPILYGGLYIVAVWAGVMVALGDRARGGQFIAVASPISDRAKIASKYLAMAAFAAGFVAVCSLNWRLSSGEPRSRWVWESFDTMFVAGPFFGALCGFAAASVVRTTTVAVLLGLALPFVGVPLGWAAARSLTMVDVPDPAWVQSQFPSWILGRAYEGALLPAVLASGAACVLVLAASGTRGLAGRGGRKRLWRGVVVSLLAAAVSAFAVAGIVVQRDGYIAAVRRAIADHAEAQRVAPTLGLDELFARGFGVAATNRTAQEVVWSARALIGGSPTLLDRRVVLNDFSEAYEVGVEGAKSVGGHFRRWPYQLSVFERDQHAPDEVSRAQQQFVLDSSYSLFSRLFCESRFPVGVRVPNLAAMLVHAKGEEERVVIIAILASRGRCGADHSSSSYQPVAEWCEILKCAREVLEGALPVPDRALPTPDRPRSHETTPARATSDVSAEDEAVIRKAIAVLSEPLLRLAEEFELKEARREARHAASGDGGPGLPPGTVDCLRNGL